MIIDPGAVLLLLWKGHHLSQLMTTMTDDCSPGRLHVYLRQYLAIQLMSDDGEMRVHYAFHWGVRY